MAKARKPAKRGKPDKAAKPGDVGLYDRINARATTANLAASRKARDIAPAPEIQDRARRDAATASLRVFLETYFPQTFRLGWCADHLKVIDRLEAVIVEGGCYALAMPRGQGKSSLVSRAALWSLLTGRRRFAVVIAANESLAELMLGHLKSELEYNDLLLADWPKVCHPIRKLESQARRCVGQLYDGERTLITWQRKRLVLPTVPGPDNEASGSLIHVAGIGGAVRGLSHVRADGETIRPDLLLVDDPADREAARSVVQTAERLAIMNGDLLGLAGPNEKIAALATVTVIFKNDVADKLLDPAVSPTWTGERYRLVKAWPERSDLWEEYLRLRAEGMLPGGDRGEGATRLYAENREAMDAGGEPSWPERFGPGELSAIQHAFNLRQDLPEDAFAAEYQNQPVDTSRDIEALDPVAIASRCSGFERGTAPPEVEKITAFVDVGGGLLWWLVAGWDERFGAHVLDYGPFPDQRVRVFAARNADPTLDAVFRQQDGGVEGAVFAGLTTVVDRLVTREWRRSDGATIPLSRIVIDAGWKDAVVRLAIRQSPHRQILTPSKGVGIGPAQVAIQDYKQRPGERLGDGWILGIAGTDRLRLLRFDTNLWKSRVAAMLTRPMGASGGVTLFGDRPVDHELLALHLSSEYPTRVEAKGNAVNEWSRRPDRDNHLWDCLIGAAVAASLEGLSPLAAIGGGVQPKQPRRQVSYTEHQARKAAGTQKGKSYAQIMADRAKERQ